jgi:hypothetical protein
MSSIAKIPSLVIKLRDGSGYPEWAREIELYLLNYHIHDIITTPKPRRESATETPYTILNSPSRWDEVNISALLLMINNTEGLARSMIIMKRTASDAWETLQKQYEGKSSNDLVSLLYNITNTRLISTTSSTTIENHIQSYSQNWERLAAAVSSETDKISFVGIHKPLTQSDVAKMAFFLGTLTDKYSLVVQSITF